MLVVLSLAIGIALGLLGGGGSILTVPLLTSVAGMPAPQAIASSLFAVAVTSVAALLGHARAGRVRWRTGLVFGACGMLGAYPGGLAARGLPSEVLMIAFGAVMLVSGASMLRGRRTAAPAATGARELPAIRAAAIGTGVGVMTGVLGAGGGFVIVPALVLLGGVPTEAEIGTSLFVFLLCGGGVFLGHADLASIDWRITGRVTAAAAAGALVGSALSGRIAPHVLRRAFGVLVLAMAILVLARELA
ncbi:MAG: sulfite exporter TauE/SafE family protein [Kofleriaceae bacterium]